MNQNQPLQIFSRGSRVTVYIPFRMDRQQIPDGYEGLWYVGRQEGRDLLLSKSIDVACDDDGEIWINISRVVRT